MKIPGLKSLKEHPERQSEKSKALPKGNDGLYAQLRRQGQELVELRRIVTDCRRDISRIEKKQYRDNGKEAPDFLRETREVVVSGYKATPWR